MGIDISAEDYCIDCGHYHNSVGRDKERECIRGRDCRCTPATFTPRSFRRKF